ncbi:MAG: RNA 2'-phosphotransferase [Anaerolineae bacterium]|nr:RNA 2'-phosphotransferase [Anaerolineae bacterium]
MSESLRYQHQLGKLSRFLLMLLRHQPARFPVRLDDQGFADLGEVLRVVHALPNLRWATLSDVEAVLHMPGPRRFEIIDDGTRARRIRALYGHTARHLDYKPVEPPDTLYFGAAPEAVDRIRREGLNPDERSYVHLVDDPQPARRAALSETPDPVVLTIDAAAACAAGITFYSPAEGLYLCAAIPPQFIT